jgi:protein SCO1
MKYKLILILLIISSLSLFSQKPPEIGIVEKLDKTIPLELTFSNSDGAQKKLKDIIDKPTVLALVYYRCPGICSPLLTELARMVDITDLKPGKDFQVLTISFDHRETPEIASKWKSNYFEAVPKKKLADNDWRFMTGDSVSIRRLADAVGFYFKPDSLGNYTHAAGIMMITKDGKIARYLLGTQYLPFDFKMSIIEASKGHSIPSVSKLLEFCYSYEPEGKKYVFNIMRIVGIGMFLSIGILFLILVKTGKKKTK